MKTDILKCLKSLSSRLRESGSTRPRFEAEYLLSEYLNCSRAELYTPGNRRLEANLLKSISDASVKRAENMPLQYIVGKTYFRQLCLKVGKGVLIPRPETELIVDISCENLADNARICDLGTGSGAIALSLAYENPSFNVMGVDKHLPALVYAEINRKGYALNNVSFVQGDFFQAFKPGLFDLVVANPPYVSREEYVALPAEVRCYEPETALRSGEDGLEHIKCVVSKAPQYLKLGGVFVMEIGAGQHQKVFELVHMSKRFDKIIKKKDLNGIDRFVKAIKVC